ncbi:MAG: lipopolysaccharide heptosyltransferase II, partial [Acidobacteriota bacterium]
AAIEKQNIKRIAVRGTNWLGDAAMTVPALRELRRLLPHAHITLVTRPSIVGLFLDADFLDEVLPYDRRGPRTLFSQVREWRQRRFDLAVIFQNAFEAALIPRLAGVPHRIGYATEGRSFLLTNPLPLPEWRSSRHEVYYYLNIVQELEFLLDGTRLVLSVQPETALPISEARRTEGLELLRTYGVQSTRPLIALCPGSINSRAKRWPAERYAALADLLIETLQAEVLLIGSPDELDVSLEVSGKMRNKPVLLTGKTDLSQAVAVLSLVDLLVTNDTGPAHVAPALGRPTLVIFGPTNPLTTRPFSSVAEIVRHPPDCAPCMLRDCPIDHRCMTAISPEDVFARARALLSDAPQKQPHGSVWPTGAVA